MATINDNKKQSVISLIVALGAHTRAIGKNGILLWHIPDDMRRFKNLTRGHTVIMGRKTWESLPEKFRPLPERTNIVITRKMDYRADGAIVVHSFKEACAVATCTTTARASGTNEIFVIGGGELYTLALPFANRLYLTLVDSNKDGDTFFPPYKQNFKTVSKENVFGEPPHQFLILKRK